MDPRQHCVQLARPTSDSPSANNVTPTKHPNGDAAHLLISMCPSLYLAVYKGRTAEVMELLLHPKGAARTRVGIGKAAAGNIRHEQCDILEVSAEMNTVLHVAAEQGHAELIQELYHRFSEHGLLLSHRNSALDTPLHCAARAGHVKAVAVLVQLARDDCGEKSILGCRNEAGDTALHLAARHGRHMVVEALVSAAAGLAAELNNAGVSPLYLAVMSGSVQAVKAITRCKGASSAGPSSQNALHAAVFQSSEMVDVLLDWRPSLADQIDSSGSSPLHFASSAGDRSIIHAILRAAPPTTVYKKDTAGLSALHVAARMGHYRVVTDMLRMYPDAAELRDGNGGTFLHTACREKQFSLVSNAIKNRLTRRGRFLQLVDAQDRDGNTALHLAVAAGAPGVVEDLLRRGGARADVLNSDGDTAFDLAAASTTASSFTMVRLVVTLVAYGARLRPQRQDQLAPWSGHDVVQGIERTSDSLAVVAVLIATSAFAAGFNVPGGYNDAKGKAHLADELFFRAFLLMDMVSVATSVVAVILLVYGKTTRSAVGSCKSFAWALQCMWVSLMSLMQAFYVALVAVMNTKSSVNQYGQMAIILCVYALQICITIWIMPAKAWSTIWRFIIRQRISDARGRNVIIKRQYPLAGASVLHFCLFTVISNICFLFFTCLILADNGSLAGTAAAPAPSPI